MKTRFIHSIVARFAHVFGLVLVLKFIHGFNPRYAYAIGAAWVIKFIANELYLLELITDEQEAINELTKFLEKTKRKDDDNV
jgi:hypothetical protein